MRKLAYSHTARADLANIMGYIAEQSGSLEVGRNFVDRLRAKCKRLAELPGTLGTARPELMPDIRSTSFHGYVIFFRYADNRVEIVNILDGNRDIAGYFST